LKNWFLYVVIITLFLAGCSSESNTLTSTAFHNTTAHFNGYFYAREEIAKIETSIIKAQADNYNEILSLYPAIDSTRALAYDKDIQEAIKMASLAIQRHPNSKWVDDCYLLVGKARLYSLDWGNATQTFKYVNTKSKDDNMRHAAIIQLARVFIEHKEFNNAESAFDFLSKEKLNQNNEKNFYLVRAHYYQLKEDYDKMVRNLTSAVPLLKRKDRPGRIYFIIGQVYQQLGFESEAFNFYKKCLGTNPEYETDFYARLYMAQVAEISRSRDLASARKSFKKLLKDSKNKEFKDKIYFELGVFERKQKNISEAITNYNLAVRLGANKQIDGEAYLHLGEIYYDSLKKYELSKSYYDSAVAALSNTHKNYKAIADRQKILSEFVTHLTTIKWQDSLLVMAKMDTAIIRKNIKAAFDKQAKADNTSKKKKRNRIEISTVNSTLDQSSSSIEGANWYFGNQSAVALGQSEFTRVWGNITLEDNWRRSTRTSSISRAQANQAIASGKQASKEAEAPIVKRNPVQEELERVIKELPLTDEQVKESLKKIEDAYFKLGDIYYFSLLENENSVITFETLLSRFPNTAYYPEVLYKLYLICKDFDAPKSARYSEMLIRQFPESDFAKIIINPNHWKESGLVLEKQKQIYKQAYLAYEEEQFEHAGQLVDEAFTLGKTPFTPNLKLLQVLLIGKTQSIEAYQKALDEYVKNTTETDLKDYAQKLLDLSKDFSTKSETDKFTQYIRSFEEPHFFIITWPVTESLDLNSVTKLLQSFNTTYFNDQNFKVSNLQLNDSYTLVLVGDLPRISTSLEYYKTFTEKRSSFNDLKNNKISTFIITKDNFDIFYRTKGLDEYLRFFEKNYKPESQ
jgi:tetratricopeptide (TPR) repeat protein